MATYLQIQDWVKLNYGFTPKTCWIADVKHQAGLPMRKAPNRQGSAAGKSLPTRKDRTDPRRAAPFWNDLMVRNACPDFI